MQLEGDIRRQRFRRRNVDESSVDTDDAIAYVRAA